MRLEPLPIDDVLDEVVARLREHPSLVLQAPAGAGKTTRVPAALLDAGLAGDGMIWVLEPRRVAARATARRIARERGVRLGCEVGYQVRFDRRMSEETRLAVVTEGILGRRLLSDPFLEGISVVVLDEFHERSVQADLALAFLREVQQVRDDLKVVVMSATIAADTIADYLGAPVIESKGRAFPVDVEWLKRPAAQLEVEAARAVRRLVEEDPEQGDVLVFMPGVATIRRTIDALESVAREHDLEVLPLYGALGAREQDRAVEPGGRRRVIVSTNIAETSLTIPGVTGVVDAGLVKQLRVSPASGLDHLETVRISAASAAQRAGRAGRLRPGRAIRLWARAQEHRLPEFDTPAVLRVDLTAPVLEVLAWSGGDPTEFDWFEAPPRQNLERSLGLLRQLEAVEPDGFRLTELGRQMLDLPVHPRQARILIEGARRGVVEEAAWMAALLSERDVVRQAPTRAAPGVSDLLRRITWLKGAEGAVIHGGRAARVEQVQAQLVRMVEESAAAGGGEEEALKALAVGFPDRLCVSRGDGRRYVTTRGEPLALAIESVVRDADFLVAASIGGRIRGPRAGGVASRGLIRMASVVQEPWLRELFGGLLSSRVDVEFDPERERVMAFERDMLGEIELSEQVVSTKEYAEPGAVAGLLAVHAAQDLRAAFGLDDADLQWLIRLARLREWMPELGLPRLEPGAEGGRFEEIMGQLCWGKRSFEELRRVALPEALKAYLSHEQIEAMRREVPEALVVPSGKRRRLRYREEGPPVLEVRIQEMFGETRTPVVARGRVRVLLHLLAPNYRPAQITDDLAGFWAQTYPQVRKELRARYSKHPWPEDPTCAKAVAK